MTEEVQKHSEPQVILPGNCYLRVTEKDMGLYGMQSDVGAIARMSCVLPRRSTQREVNSAEELVPPGPLFSSSVLFLTLSQLYARENYRSNRNSD